MDSLSDSERKAVQERIEKLKVYRESVVYVDREVRVSKDLDRKGGKGAKRLLVLTSHRLWLFRKATLGGGKKLDKEIHLYDILTLKAVSSRLLSVGYATSPPPPPVVKQDLKKNNRGTRTGSHAESGFVGNDDRHVDHDAQKNRGDRAGADGADDDGDGDEQQQQKRASLDVRCANLVAFVTALRLAYRRVSAGFSASASWREDLDSSCVEPLDLDSVFEADTGCADGATSRAYAAFLGCYFAQCSYAKAAPSGEFVTHVRDRMACGDRVLDLAECPGAAPKSELTFDSVPVMASLRHNTYFRAARIDGRGGGDLALLAGVLRHNTTLARVEIVDQRAYSSRFELVGEALRRNAANGVQVLVARNCADMASAGFRSLGVALHAMRHGLLVLDVGGCSCSSAGVAALVGALRENYPMSLALQTLVLSGNKLGEQGSEELARWLDAMLEHSWLASLQLERCSATLVDIVRPLASLPHLEHLDVGGNKMPPSAAHMLASALLAGSRTLRRLSVANCSLGGAELEALARALFNNDALFGVDLDLSGNSVASKHAVSLGQVFNLAAERSTDAQAKLHTLRIAHMKLAEKHLGHWLDVLARVPMHTLVADRLLKGGKRALSSVAATRVGNALGVLAERNVNLRALSVAGGYAPLAIAQLLEQLGLNTSLLELNIACNKAGDLAASALASLLRYNYTLRSVISDANNFSFTGYVGIASAVRFNTTLCSFPMPWRDFSKCLPQLRRSQRDYLRRALVDMQRRLLVNVRDAGMPLSALSLKPDEPIELPAYATPAAPTPARPLFEAVRVRASRQSQSAFAALLAAHPLADVADDDFALTDIGGGAPSEAPVEQQPVRQQVEPPPHPYADMPAPIVPRAAAPAVQPYHPQCVVYHQSHQGQTTFYEPLPESSEQQQHIVEPQHRAPQQQQRIVEPQYRAPVSPSQQQQRIVEPQHRAPVSPPQQQQRVVVPQYQAPAIPEQQQRALPAVPQQEAPAIPMRAEPCRLPAAPAPRPPAIAPREAVVAPQASQEELDALADLQQNLEAELHVEGWFDAENAAAVAPVADPGVNTIHRALEAEVGVDGWFSADEQERQHATPEREVPTQPATSKSKSKPKTPSPAKGKGKSKSRGKTRHQSKHPKRDHGNTASDVQQQQETAPAKQQQHHQQQKTAQSKQQQQQQQATPSKQQQAPAQQHDESAVGGPPPPPPPPPPVVQVHRPLIIKRSATSVTSRNDGDDRPSLRPSLTDVGAILAGALEAKRVFLEFSDESWGSSDGDDSDSGSDEWA
jgi:hypothetical protein